MTSTFRMSSSDPEEMRYLIPSTSSSEAFSTTEADQRRLVWIPDPGEGFVRAVVIDESNDQLLVQLEQSHAQIRLSADECQKANPARFYKTPNMADLTCLNDASVLHNLKQRYLSGLIYTYSGLFCVVVNPYRRLPIYSDEIMKFYKGKRPEDVPPHVFALTDRAYRAMLLDRQDQSILCTGESGAGKTENTKKVVQYLAYVARSPRTSNERTSKAGGQPITSAADLELQLLQTNPILESFGNARTVKNDNSSRFGKFIRVNFDSVGFITGGSVETYLLEKSRTVRQAKNERSFHIFYQLLRSFCPSAATANYPILKSIGQKAGDLLLDQIEQYSYISHGNIELPGSDDLQQFVATLEALKIMDISEDQIISICTTLSAILLIGNLEFVNDRDSNQALLPDDTVAQKVARLLGLNVTEFTRSILNPRVKCGREVVNRAQDKKQVEFALEAVAKATYEQLFKWILGRINRTLSKASKRRPAYFIGILDIAGFEIFEMNSFEQLCINYTNEKLQQLFNHTMFVLEQREYAKEAIEWKFMDFGLDLQPTIDLIEKGMGVLPLLDEECVFPNSTDRTYVEKLISVQSQNRNFAKPTVRSKHDFSVIHYAGAVNYCVDQWLVKNTDPINDNIVHLLQDSQQAFIRDIWKTAELITLHSPDATPLKTSIKKGMFRTVGQMYKEQLNSLMNILNSTTPNFIRCIIPNRTKSPAKMEANLVLAQLRCNGVLEGIRICRHGFPNRIPFQEFRHRYEVLCSSLVPRAFADGRVVCERIVSELELDSNLYRIGHTKIFFRAGVLAHLEEERDQKISEIITHLQCLCRGKMARNQFRKRMQQIKSMRIVQRNGRVLLNICDWNWFKLFTKIKPMLNVTRLDQMIQCKDRELAVSVQAVSRLQARAEEMEKRMEQLLAERNVAADELAQERELSQELADCRARLLSRKVELEKIVQDLEARLDEDTAKVQGWALEKSEFQAGLKELKDSLNEEERRRQLADLQKMSAETSAKKFEESLLGKTAELERVQRAREVCEQRLAKLDGELRLAGERAREFVRLKVKNEAKIADLEARLKSEAENRAKFESSARGLDRELVENRDQLNELRQEIEEVRLSLAKKDRELTAANASRDEQCGAMSSLQRELRDLRECLAEAREDLRSEQDLRKKADINRRDLSEENEALRNEITGHSDTNALMQDQFKKREEEVNELRKRLVQEQEEKLEAVQAVKSRLSEQLKLVSDELLASQRTNQLLLKERDEFEARLSDRDSELVKAQSARDSARNRLKLVEADLQASSEAVHVSEQSRQLLEGELGQLRRSVEHWQSSNAVLESKLSETNSLLQASKSELDELRLRLEQEVDGKQVLEGRLVVASSELDGLAKRIDEKTCECSRLSSKCQSLMSCLAETRSQCQSDFQSQLEEQRRGFQREKDAISLQFQDLSSQHERLLASRSKLQNELADVSVELDKYRSSCSALEKSQRQIDRKLADERLLQDKLRVELEVSERDNREKETKLIGVQYELKDKEDALKASELRLKQLRSELEDALSGKDDVGRSVCGLERMNRTLQQQNDEYLQRINDLELELANTESARLRADVNMNALRQQLERQMLEANEASDDRYRSAMKQLREVENELDEERKARSMAVSAHKKAELDVADLRVELADLARVREDDVRSIKRNTLTIKELRDELESTRIAREDLGREWERRYCSLEQMTTQLQDEKDEVDKCRRALVSELDELKQELDSLKNGDASSLARWTDEKRRLEAKISELDEDLSEESAQASVLGERLRLLAQQNDQLIVDLNAERLNVSRAEVSRETSDRMVRELKQKLLDADELLKTRTKLAVAGTEKKLSSVEQQLEIEQNDRLRMVRLLRGNEKKLRELGLRYDEERNATSNAREQAESALGRIRQLKKQIDELEESSAEISNKNRKLQREKDSLENQLALKDQKIRQYESRSSMSTVGTIRAASVTLRNIASTPISSTGGDIDVLDEDEDDASSSNTGSSYSAHIPQHSSFSSSMRHHTNFHHLNHHHHHNHHLPQQQQPTNYSSLQSMTWNSTPITSNSRFHPHTPPPTAAATASAASNADTTPTDDKHQNAQ